MLATPAIASFVLRSSRKRRSKLSGTCTNGAHLRELVAGDDELQPDAGVAQRFAPLEHEPVVDAPRRLRLLRLLEQLVGAEVHAPVRRRRHLRERAARTRASSAIVARSRTYDSATVRANPSSAPSGRKRICTSSTTPGRNSRTSHQYGAYAPPATRRANASLPPPSSST